jgi:signal transduction histidine kinase
MPRPKSPVRAGQVEASIDGPEIADGINVLLVDDEAGFRAILKKRLSRRGIYVREASGSEEALRLLDQDPADVVVLDVRMPGMDGLEALGHIRQRFPNTEVIMLTGHATTRDGVSGIQSGAFDYLSKPVEVDHLVRKITQAHDKTLRALAAKEEAEFRERIKQQMVVAERLVALGTMATGVAHEINNPMAIIQEAAGWLQQILATPEAKDIPRRADFEKALTEIENAVRRARRITQQLLQVARDQTLAVSAPSDLADVNLEEIALECMTLVEAEASSKGVTVSLDSTDPPPRAWTDHVRLTQVLLNLLNNAVHATETGGRITIALQAESEQAHIVLQDTGCGIPEEHLTKIFEPFFTTKPVGDSTGMGLYVSWGIVDQLGGLISVESQPRKGSTFTITLPMKA